MRAHSPLSELTAAERLNFLLTNRIPRRWLTLLVGRFSKIRSPIVSRISIWLWQKFVDDLRLEEARESTFASLYDCFTRELKPGARPIDWRSDIVTSPCDAVVGEFGYLRGVEALQAKGFPYSTAELLGSLDRAARFRDGRFMTLRLKSSMYHRFHAPCDGYISALDYVSGDTWNVNPIALQVIERLYCKNERAILDLEVATGAMTLVPIAAVLVASMRFHGVEEPFSLAYRGATRIELNRHYKKGDEIGYFEHGSTIVMLTTRHYSPVLSIRKGDTVRMGEPLMQIGSRNNSKSQ